MSFDDTIFWDLRHLDDNKLTFFSSSILVSSILVMVWFWRFIFKHTTPGSLVYILWRNHGADYAQLMAQLVLRNLRQQ